MGRVILPPFSKGRKGGILESYFFRQISPTYPQGDSIFNVDDYGLKARIATGTSDNVIFLAIRWMPLFGGIGHYGQSLKVPRPSTSKPHSAHSPRKHRPSRSCTNRPMPQPSSRIFPSRIFVSVPMTRIGASLRYIPYSQVSTRGRA